MRRISKKRARQDYLAKPARDVYRALRGDVCAVCWTREGRIELHHLAGRNSRERDEPGNWLFICDRCHRHYHSGGEIWNGVRLPELTPGMLMNCKAELCEMDAALICRIKGWKALPIHWEPKALPEEFQRLRVFNT